MVRGVMRITAAACLLLLAGCARGAAASPGAGSNERAAQVEADRILSVFDPPAGATRLSAAPTSAPILAEPLGGIPGTPDLVDRAAWWTVRGDAATVLAAIVAHRPDGSVSDQSFDYSDPTQHVFGDAFDWPAVPDVLDERQMQVAVVQKGAETAIRVDAVVTYLPPRPADAHVPPSATTLTVRMTARTYNPPTAADLYGPVLVTDQDKVAKVAAVVNTAQVPMEGRHGCPNAAGTGSMTLDFAGPDGAPVATVEIGLVGCGGITVTLPDGRHFDLAGDADQVDRIITLLGLGWPKQSGPVVSPGRPPGR